jgi:recombinational DNA repair protein (RecF pathway)
MTIRCAKCGTQPDGLKMKAGKLLCAKCAEPSKVPHHRRAYIAELAMRRLESGGR